MARADRRYLKQRHQGWYFVTAVPRALRGRFVSAGHNGRPGKPLSKIVVSLNTQSLREAQDKRWPLVQEWRAQFERAASGAPLTLSEIGAIAGERYAAILVELEALAKRKGSAEFHRYLSQLAERIQRASEGFGGIEPLLSAGTADLLGRAVAEELARLKARTGITLEPGSESYKALCEALVRAHLAAIEGRLRAAHGAPSEPPTSFLGARGVDPVTLRPIVPVKRPQVRIRPDGGMRFSEAASRYIDAKRKAGKINEHTQRKAETVFRLFMNFAGDAPLAAIDKLTATDFLEQIGKLDPNWFNVEDAPEMPLAKLIEKCASRPGRLTNRTINSYIHALSGVFKLADKEGHFEGRNPFAGRTLEEPENPYLPFKIEELNALFGAPLLRDMPAAQRIRPAKYTFENAMAWIPLIGLFSGMRSNEICQMRASDVQRKDGLWLFHVSAEADGQRLKTEAATRVVPVHSELIRCGFLDYLKALPDDGQLFPALKPGGQPPKHNHYFAKQFTLYRRRCGVTAPRKVFHSFRKNVAQALKDKRATPAEIAELIGHEQGFTLSVYAPMQLPTKTLKELIERVRYLGLRLDHLHV
jgi:integrase